MTENGIDLIWGLPDFFILIGVIIIVIGFIFKLDTLFTVVLAGIVTGLVVQLPVVGTTDNPGILDTLGSAFVSNRYMTIFILSLPVIGMLEKNGLKEVATEMISKIKSATQGRIISIYLFFRTIAAAGGLRLQGHVLFIRPLILPMAEGAAESNFGDALDDKDREKIKGLSGASENFANFFGQDAFVAGSGVLLIVGTLNDAGYDVSAAGIAGWSWLILFCMLVVGIIYFSYHDRLMFRKYKKKANNINATMEDK